MIKGNVLSDEINISLHSHYISPKYSSSDETSKFESKIVLLLNPKGPWKDISDAENEWGCYEITSGMEPIVCSELEENRSFDYKLCLDVRKKVKEEKEEEENDTKEEVKEEDEKDQVQVYVNLFVKNKMKIGKRFLSRFNNPSFPLIPYL